jgi:hypothetical protein
VNPKRTRTLKVIEKASREAAKKINQPVAVLVEFLRGDFLSVILELNTEPNDPLRSLRIEVALTRSQTFRDIQSVSYVFESPQITVVTGYDFFTEQRIDDDILCHIEKALCTLIETPKK